MVEGLRRAFTLFLFLGIVAAGAGSPAGGSALGDPGMAISSLAAVTPADGDGWWVLERSLDGFGGVVYRYSPDWVRTGEEHRIRLSNTTDRYREFSPTDLVPAPDGGWWVTDDRGRIHRFSSNFSYTGESHGLRTPRSEYNASSAFGMLATPSGGWWLAADRDFWRTDGSRRPANDTVVAIYRGGRGIPVAFAYGSDRSLWVLRGASADRFRLANDGTRVRDVRTPESGVHPLPRLAVPRETHRLDEPDAPVDLVKRSDGWWIADADGEVHAYDREWQYTGVTHEVGSGSAVSSYPPDDGSGTRSDGSNRGADSDLLLVVILLLVPASIVALLLRRGLEAE